MATLLRAPTRDYRSPIMDSHRWDHFRPRDGDIIVATYPKCGTTWTQRIVDMLIHQSSDPRPIMTDYPWLDATFFEPIDAVLGRLEGQSHRRAVKSHLPFDSLPLYDGVKYIHVARDGRDACISMHNHQLGFTESAVQRINAVNGLPPEFRPPPTPQDPREFYLQWIGQAETAGPAPRDLPFFEYEMTYWRERTRPNLLLVHYNDLKTDLPAEMRRISDFLGIATPQDKLTELAQAAGFEAMKRQGGRILPELGEFFDRGYERFLNKGVNGRWKDVLGEADLARYAALARQRLSDSAAAWIEHGGLVAGEPRTAPD